MAFTKCDKYQIKHYKNCISVTDLEHQWTPSHSVSCTFLKMNIWVVLRTGSPLYFILDKPERGSMFQIPELSFNMVVWQCYISKRKCTAANMLNGYSRCKGQHGRRDHGSMSEYSEFPLPMSTSPLCPPCGTQAQDPQACHFFNLLTGTFIFMAFFCSLLQIKETTMTIQHLRSSSKVCFH